MKFHISKLYTLYPFLFAFYPVLSLLAPNIDQVNPNTVIRPLIFSVVFSLILWFLLSLLLRNIWKSGLLTLTIEVLFFSYGHIQRLISKLPGIGTVLGKDLFLGFLALGLLALLAFWIIRTHSGLYSISVFLTYANVCLLVMPLFQIGDFYWETQKALPSLAELAIDPEEQQEKPDIYLIVMDSYSRQDLMKADFDFDNQSFIDQLSSLGFQVMPCSRSNYNGTALSLSSMLNLNYETTLGVDAASISQGKDTMTPFIKNNQVRSFVEGLGYQVYSFDTGYPGLDWPDTTNLTTVEGESPISREMLPIESMFIKDTSLNIILNSNIGISKPLQSTVDSPYTDHINLVKDTLTILPGTVDLAGPKFVYAHLILPHKPFIFDAQGDIRTDANFYKDTDDSPVNEEYYRVGYVGQVEYANSQMIPILEEILENSSKPPIIILMGDHGYAAVDTRFENLMAVYLPGDHGDLFYPSISNVNVFREIFNGYFSEDFEILPDKSYRIDFKKGVYLNVPEIQPGCLNNPFIRINGDTQY